MLQELLTEGVDPIPLVESTVVEGTVCPTTASSPDVEVHGTLAAELKKKKLMSKSANRRQKYSIAN